MVFCNTVLADSPLLTVDVTILILIDGFLQYKYVNILDDTFISHNPYFNRWFSAINRGQ